MKFLDSFKLVLKEHKNGYKQIFQMALKDLKSNFQEQLLELHGQ